MKFISNKKGQVRIIEAFLASILLLSALAFVPSDTEQKYSNYSVLRSTALQILTTLDNDGSLSKLIENQSWTALRKCVQSSLPPSVWFNLTVFDENMESLNDVQISCGGPTSEEIVSVEYVCASSSNNFRIYYVCIQMSTVK